MVAKGLSKSFEPGLMSLHAIIQNVTRANARISRNPWWQFRRYIDSKIPSQDTQVDQEKKNAAQRFTASIVRRQGFFTKFTPLLALISERFHISLPREVGLTTDGLRQLRQLTRSREIVFRSHRAPRSTAQDFGSRHEGRHPRVQMPISSLQNLCEQGMCRSSRLRH